MQVRLARGALGAGILGEIAAFAYYLHALAPTSTQQHSNHLRLQIIATVAFVVAVIGLRYARLQPRQVAVVVLATGAMLQCLALTRPPQTSDDSYRYIWDAKVQFAGIDPYRYTPSAPQLDHLRSAPLFGRLGPCDWTFPGGCTAINRPTVHTIYPPVAQAAFDAVRAFSFGGHGNQFPLQLAAALGSLAVGFVLIRRALREKRAVWLAALWLWCPVVVSEFGNNAHIDWLAVLLSVLGLQTVAARRTVRSGLLLGAAIATKLYPALLLFSALRRRPWLLLGSAGGLVAFSYLPHVAAVGTNVIGYLPGYLHEEGYSTGNHLLLLGWVLPHPLDTGAAMLVMAVALIWTARRADPLAPERSAVVVTGLALLVATPRYGWYAALLLAVIVMAAAWEWLPVALAPSFAYLSAGDINPEWIYLAAALSTVVLIAWRSHRVRRAARRSTAARMVSGLQPRSTDRSTTVAGVQA